MATPFLPKATSIIAGTMHASGPVYSTPMELMDNSEFVVVGRVEQVLRDGFRAGSVDEPVEAGIDMQITRIIVEEVLQGEVNASNEIIVTHTINLANGYELDDGDSRIILFLDAASTSGSTLREFGPVTYYMSGLETGIRTVLEDGRTVPRVQTKTPLDETLTLDVFRTAAHGEGTS